MANDSPETNRRAFPRLGVYSGNAEITRVLGRGRRPGDRARIVNWSRGGMCLRVSSPRRKLLFWRRDPALFVEDSVTCTLRLAPVYNDIAVEADVVRVERCADDPDVLEVGLRFDAAFPAERLEAIARILEPKPRTTSVRAPRAEARSTRTKARAEAARNEPAPGVADGVQDEVAADPRMARKSARVAATSGRLPRTSERLAKAPSERVTKPRTTERLPRAEAEAAPAKPAKVKRAGEPMALPADDAPKSTTHSQRLRMGETESLQLRGSARLARQSGRLR
jgi:hypothetical protein